MKHKLLVIIMFSLYGFAAFAQAKDGKGIVIAVPAPTMKNAAAADAWMPQFFQDIITGDFARFSKMTVIDRSNEKLAVDEQELSESGFYSDSELISIGNMTQAQYVVAGNITNVSGKYTVSFRINDIEKNVSEAAFNKQFVISDMQNGYAAKETVLELLTGMGIEVSAKAKAELQSKSENAQTKATASLAQGMAAEKSGDLVDALAHFHTALDSNSGMREASAHIQTFSQGSPGTSIRERANWATAQSERWNKIFKDLETYAYNNLLIVVYDFTTITDKIDTRSNTVELEVGPGIKFIPNRTVLAVWKTVIDNWLEIKSKEENKSWVGAVKVQYEAISYMGGGLNFHSIGHYYYAKVVLYDENGDKIATSSVGQKTEYVKYMNKPFDLLVQKKYYDNAELKKVKFSRVKLADITDNLVPKIDAITIMGSVSGKAAAAPALVFTVSEYQQWAAAQGGGR
jgi:TolB-like protein